LTANTEWDRVERTLGADALSRLGRKSVAVIGLGSGGGFVAQALAMSGVGRFILIDNDTLEPGNVVRHIADRRYVGQTKVEATADLIRQRNPAAEVRAIVGLLEDHIDALAGTDLVVVGIDNERPKYAINEKCRELGLPAVYAGVYERGEGGDVVLIRPDSGPCYACWAQHLREDLVNLGPGETELDYGMIGADGTLAAEPGLWLHVVRVAAAQADMALNELLQGTAAHRELPGNTVILANHQMEILVGTPVPPYSAQWVTVDRDPNCLVCGRRDAAEIMTLDSLLADQPHNGEQQSE
jgi:molybdopterin/thiamine biosynthesis adenylyltransferase